MTINVQGKIETYQFYPALIHSAARLTYTEVAKFLSDPNHPQAMRCAALGEPLHHLHHAYLALAKARKKRGALDFDTVQTQIVYNEQGKIAQIVPCARNEAHKLIEECMLAANVCAADFLKRHNHPGLYRVHAKPTEEKLANLRRFLQGLGLKLGGSTAPQGSDYAKLITQIHDRPDASMLKTMLLRSMQQAVYSPENIGHFGLAYEAYAHFTSPIRRYPDLLVHRALREILKGRQYRPAIDPDIILDAPFASADQSSEIAIWQRLGQHCSAHERRADEASRDVEAWLKCYFMQDKIAQIYSGVVNGVAPFGLFVQLDTLFIEGLVHVTELGQDFFKYDEIKNELRGERTGTRYRLTDRLSIQVSGIDWEARRISFRLLSASSIP
jgi:ribonuclease R